MKLMYKLERFLLSLKYNTQEKRKLPVYKLSLLDLQKKYNEIDNYNYDLESTKIIKQGDTKENIDIALLDVKLKYDKITTLDYHKEKNDILKKPWVAIKTNYDEADNPDNIELEVVYNKTFIKKMRKKGLSGSDEEIVDQWLRLFFISNLDDSDIAMINE